PRPKSLPPPRSASPIRLRTVGRKWAPYEDLYHTVLTSSWWLFVLLVAVAFLSANALFACAYLMQPGSITNVRPGSFEDAFFYPVETRVGVRAGQLLGAC